MNVRVGLSQFRHVIGLEPQKDSEKIINTLWRYGTETVKSKLCRLAIRSLGLYHADSAPGLFKSEDELRYMDMMKTRAMENLEKKLENEFHPVVDLETYNINNNTYEAELDRLRHILTNKPAFH